MKNTKIRLEEIFLDLYIEREYGATLKNALWVGKEKEDYLQS